MTILYDLFDPRSFSYATRSRPPSRCNPMVTTAIKGPVRQLVKMNSIFSLLFHSLEFSDLASLEFVNETDLRVIIFYLI